MLRFLPYAIVGLGILIALFIIDMQHNEINKLLNQRDILLMTVQNVTADNKQLQKSLDDQNKAVNALKEASDTKALENKEALKIAQNSANLHKRNAEKIITQSPLNANDLDSTNNLINNTLNLK